MSAVETSGKMSPSPIKKGDIPKGKVLAQRFPGAVKGTMRKSVSGVQFPGLATTKHSNRPKEPKEPYFTVHAGSSPLRRGSRDTSAASPSQASLRPKNGDITTNGRVELGRQAVGANRASAEHSWESSLLQRSPNSSRANGVPPISRPELALPAASTRLSPEAIQLGDISKNPGSPTSRNGFPPRGRSNGVYLNGDANGDANNSSRSSSNGVETISRPTRLNGRSTAVRSPRRSSAMSRPTSSLSKRPQKRKRIALSDDSDEDGVSAAMQEFHQSIRTLEYSAGEESDGQESGKAEMSRPVTRGREEGEAAEDRKPEKVTLRRANIEPLDEAKFDQLIYQQEGAAQPPDGVVISSAVQRNKARQSGRCVHDRPQQLYLPIDPRVHWIQDRGDEWYKKKAMEIRKRGGRKTSFGKLTQVAKRREDALVRQITSAGDTAKEYDPAEKEKGRPLDFGRVDEKDLPDIVQANPAWMNVVAWMRTCTEKSTQRQKEVEKRQRAIRP